MGMMIWIYEAFVTETLDHYRAGGAGLGLFARWHYMIEVGMTGILTRLHAAMRNTCYT